MNPRRVASLGLVVLAACDPFHAGFEPIEAAEMYEAARLEPAAAPASVLRIMTWNIKFAGGRERFFWECNGDRANMSAREVERHLDGIAAKINQVDPDVVLLQEADVESKRCAYVDNVQYLLDHTRLNYGAYASQWRVDYIPSDGLGRMDSGNAVLSKFPIDDATRISLPQMKQDAVTDYFYLRRNLLRAAVRVAGWAPVWFVATHLEAFGDAAVKQEQIALFERWLVDTESRGGLVVGGGDLNAIPRGSVVTRDFPDDCDDARYEGDDYSGQEAWLDRLFDRYEATFSPAEFAADNTRHFTFTGDERVPWNRTLDYLFTNGNLQSSLVHQSAAQGGMETIMLSDHAPVTASLELVP